MTGHNFGECRQCGCLTTRLMDVTNIATGEKSQRVCCRLNPGSHWRPATEEDIRLDAEAAEEAAGAAGLATMFGYRPGEAR